MCSPAVQATHSERRVGTAGDARRRHAGVRVRGQRTSAGVRSSIDVTVKLPGPSSCAVTLMLDLQCRILLSVALPISAKEARSRRGSLARTAAQSSSTAGSLPQRGCPGRTHRHKTLLRSQAPALRHPSVLR